MRQLKVIAGVLLVLGLAATAIGYGMMIITNR